MALFAHMETLLQTITGIWNQFVFFNILPNNSTPGKIPYLYILKSAIWYYYLCLSDCIADNHDIKKKTHTA